MKHGRNYASLPFWGSKILKTLITFSLSRWPLGMGVFKGSFKGSNPPK